MKRSAITNHDNDNNKTAITNDINNHQNKRSLEDYGFLKNIKRRRHLSPQNSNIDLNNDTNNSTTLSPIKKKPRTKSKNQSIDSTNESPRVSFLFF